VALAAATAALTMTSVTFAASSVYHDATLAAGAVDGDASHSAFLVSFAQGDSMSHKIQAGAHFSGGWTLYANYAEGYLTACHSYDGSQTLGGLVRNPHTVPQFVYAQSGWGGSVSC
jgi:hypothetical protein